MESLLIFSPNAVSFDHDEVERVLKAIPGTYRHREDGDIASTYEAFFDYGDDSTIARLSEDGNVISISGLGNASLQLALEIQARIDRPLNVVDSSDSFEISLRDVSTLDVFRQEIAKGRAEG